MNKGVRHYAQGTWIDPEECAYTPRGAQVRRGRAIFPDGNVRAFRAGIADTFFSVPAHATLSHKYVAGFVSINDDGALEFTPYAR